MFNDFVCPLFDQTIDATFIETNHLQMSYSIFDDILINAWIPFLATSFYIVIEQWPIYCLSTLLMVDTTLTVGRVNPFQTNLSFTLTQWQANVPFKLNQPWANVSKSTHIYPWFYHLIYKVQHYAEVSWLL